MIEVYPKYYSEFKCIAGDCEDTCCAGWEIDIDDISYEKYMQVQGELGAKLHRCIAVNTDIDEDMYEQHGFVLTDDHRCPFLDTDNLCEIYRELGEDALCEVCTNTPRNYLEYGGVREISVSASCPEAARLIYGSKERMEFSSVQTDEEFPFDEDEEEIELAKFIRRSKEQAISILQNRDIDINNRIVIFLKHSELIQDCLNKGDFSIEKVETEYKNSCLKGNYTDVDYHIDLTKTEIYDNFLLRFRTFSGLASIGYPWKEKVELIYDKFVGTERKNEDNYIEKYNKTIENLEQYMYDNNRIYEYEHLLVYYAFLLLGRSVDDMDYLTKAKLVVLSYLMNRDMDAACFDSSGKFTTKDREENARIYAREVEHAEENLADLSEEVIFEKALLDIFDKKM